MLELAHPVTDCALRDNYQVRQLDLLGFNQVAKSMETSNIRGNAIKSMSDGRQNYSKVGMLNLNTIPANGPKSIM